MHEYLHKRRLTCRRPSPDLCQSYGHVTWCRPLSRQPNSWRSFEVSCLIDRETEKNHDAWVNKLNLVGKSPVITWSFGRWGVRYQNPTCFSKSAISVKSAPINISLISFRHPRNRLSWEWGKNDDAPSGYRASCSNDSAIHLARVVWRTRKNTGQTEYTRIYDRVGAATTGCGVVCCTCTRGRAVIKVMYMRDVISESLQACTSGRALNAFPICWWGCWAERGKSRIQKWLCDISSVFRRHVGARGGNMSGMFRLRQSMGSADLTVSRQTCLAAGSVVWRSVYPVISCRRLMKDMAGAHWGRS